MSPFDLNQSLFNRVCCGNAEAIEFLTRWSNYVHAIDDVEDDETTSDFRIKIYIMALELYTCQFFLKNLTALKQMVYTVTNLYSDSINWEKSIKQEEKDFAKWSSHSAVEMVLAVAVIVGGYDHMRSVSEELRMVNWAKHHE